MVQSFSCRPLVVEVWVRSLVSPCDICSGKSDTETGFPYQHHSTSSLYYYYYYYYYYSYSYYLLFIIRTTSRPSLETSIQSKIPSDIGSIGEKNYRPVLLIS